MNPIDVLRKHGSAAARELELADEPPYWVRGKGATLWAADGRDFIDFASGSAVSNTGHGNEEVAEAIRAQVATGILHTGTFIPSEAKARLIDRIVRLTPPSLTRAHLTVTGGEAVEAALKAAKYATGRHNFIAFWGAYHGRPTGALGLTGYRSYRDPFFPMNPGVHHFPYPYPYRNPFGVPADDEAGLLALTLGYLEAALAEGASGLAPIAAIIVEPIQGVGGVVIPPKGFLQGLRRVCDQYGLLLILDEIFCGFGRTGTWFGCNAEDVVPDIMVLSKGVGGGLPVAGIVGTEAVMTAWTGGMQSSTYEGNPVACAAGAASIDFSVSHRLLENVARIERAISAWAPSIREVPSVGEVRGRGAMWGIEIVEPGTSRPDQGEAKRLQRTALAEGVLVYRGGHFGNVLSVLPPLVATADEVESGLHRLGRVVAAATAEIKPALAR